MKQGQEVKLFFPDEDKPVKAVVLDVVGVGKSNFKILKLKHGGDPGIKAENVHHERDYEEGRPYWMLSGEKRTRGEEDDPEPVDTIAFPDHTPAAPPQDEKPPRRRSPAAGGTTA